MILNEYDFYQELLYNGTIQNRTLDFGNEEIEIIGFTNDTIELINCRIVADIITFRDIRNQDLSVRFQNCYIEAKLRFVNCQFMNLEFRNIQSLISLDINRGFNLEENNILRLNRFYFTYNKQNDILIETDFYFKECFFEREFAFDYVNHIAGRFIFELNKIGNSDLEENNTHHYFNIANSILNNVCFHKNNFLSTFLMNNCVFNYKQIDRLKYLNTTFSLNKFSKIAFQNSNFTDKTIFARCQFMDLAYFENIKNLENSNLNFIDCEFEKYITFTGAEIANLSLEKSIFKNTVSFQDAVFKTLRIDKPHFDKHAYFDGMHIKEIDKCDRSTIRNIKQQLQKTDNKIDYNRFRAYELSAYYRELKWWGNFRDWFILAATKAVTGFDHSWRRALCFTIIAAGLFYSLFYISENYMQTLAFAQWRQFLSGYFRFLIVTDFYNPLADGRSYIDNTNTIGWFIFILGKIVIAFGIYEMIQAFRKFKA